MLRDLTLCVLMLAFTLGLPLAVWLAARHRVAKIVARVRRRPVVVQIEMQECPYCRRFIGELNTRGEK